MLHNDWFTKITNKTTIKFKNVVHVTVNYIDDSTSVIAFKDHTFIRRYLNDYYTLLHSFYNVKKLKINPDKTLFMVICKEKMKNHFKNYYFMANLCKINVSHTIKILGHYLRDDLKMDSQIGTLCASLHNKLFNLRKVNKYTDFNTRLNF